MDRMFWARVHFGPSCWEWMGRIDKWGYGELYMGGKAVRAHRASWTFENGPIPAGLCVCHRCDNPRCVRADHLFLGTHADNAADKTRKGRTPSGERHWARRRTHCRNGHPYDAANSYLNLRGRRVCRECQRKTKRAPRTKKAAPTQALLTPHRA